MRKEFAVQGSHESWLLVSCLARSRMQAFPRTSLFLKRSSHTSVNVRVMGILFILIASISNYEHLCLILKNGHINTDYQECVIVNAGGSGKYCHCSHQSSSPDSTVSHQTIKKRLFHTLKPFWCCSQCNMLNILFTNMSPCPL